MADTGYTWSEEKEALIWEEHQVGIIDTHDG